MGIIQASRHFPVSIERRSGVFLVNESHQLQVERRFTGRLPTVSRPIKANQLALTANTQQRMVCFYHGLFSLNRTG
jgi:hypothetical protein